LRSASIVLLLHEFPGSSFGRQSIRLHDGTGSAAQKACPGQSVPIISKGYLRLQPHLREPVA
jgi:hypothetical protein